MSEQPSPRPPTRVEKIIDWLRSQRQRPLIALIIIISAILVFFANTTSAVKDICEFFGIRIVPPSCEVDKKFAVKILYADDKTDMKNRIKSKLNHLNYFENAINTNFSEFQEPGAKGTARIIYPKCISRKNNEPLQKVIDILKEEGYVESKTLEVVPNRDSNFTKDVQVSLF